MTKYTTIQQHEPIRIPTNWNEQERRLVAQLEEILDDLYRRFNRIRMEDLSPSLGKTITETKDGMIVLESKVTQTAEKLESLVVESGDYTIYVQPDEPAELPIVGDIWIKTPAPKAWNELAELTWDSLAESLWNDFEGSGEATSFFWNGSEWALMVDPNQIAVLSTAIEQTAREIALKANKGDPATGVETTLVSITANGVVIKTGGTFTVESGNFELDEQGNMSAQNAYLSGNVFTNGHPALSEYDIYVGTNAPSAPHTGMVWIKPDESTSASTTFSKTITWGDRQNMVDNVRTGTMAGTATESVGSVFTYRVRIPVYIREFSGGKTGGELHLDLYDKDGGTQLLSVVRNVTIDEYGSGNKVIDITMSGDAWIGNRASMFFRLYVKRISGYYAYNVLNSSDNSAAITVNCTATSSGGASGWRECAVFSFA